MKSPISGILLSSCIGALAACATHEAPAPLSARDHDALAAQASNQDGDRAAEHRAAAQSLRDQEAQACAGISVAERNAGPFGTPQQVAKVEPLNEPLRVGKVTYSDVHGSKVTVLATPGMTSQWLTRLAQCHAARHATEGIAVDEGKPCPFAAGPVTVSVATAPTSFVVSIRSETPNANAQRILAESEALRVGEPDSRSAATDRVTF